jgi:hypothetical protein
MLAPNPSPHQSKSRRCSKASQFLGELSVADGRQAVGTIEQASDRWVAITMTGNRLGPFNTMAEAARALPRILGSSEVSA